MQRPLAVALSGLAALAVAMGIGRFAFTPILPMMLEEHALGVAEGGWLASANYFGYLAGGLSAVALNARPALVIRASLAAVAISTLAMGATSAIAAWMFWRAVAGVASAWVLVFASSWCLERICASAPPGEHAVLGASVFGGVGVGIALAGLACLALSVAHVSSATAWITLGVLAMGASVLVWSQFGDGAAAARPAPARGRGVQRAWIPMIACYGAFGFGYIIPATFLSAMAREAMPDPAIYGWSWPIFGAAAAASTFAAARLSRRFSDRAVWIGGNLVMAVGVVVPLASHRLAAVIVSGLLVGGTFMVLTMAGLQEARRVAGTQARALMAAMTSSFALGQIAGPLLVSYLAARGHGYAPALALAGGALAASAIALRFIPSTRPS